MTVMNDEELYKEYEKMVSELNTGMPVYLVKDGITKEITFHKFIQIMGQYPSDPEPHSLIFCEDGKWKKMIFNPFEELRIIDIETPFLALT
jgi:hypothetical protein